MTTSPALAKLDAIISKVQSIALPASPESSEPRLQDHAWNPQVPLGHTSFSWTGRAGLRAYSLPSDNYRAEAKAEKTVTVQEKTAATVPEKEEVTAGGDLAVFAKLDVRVGKVVEAAVHPDADALYLEKVDLGEPEGPRQIISGLVKYVPLEEFIGKQILVFANLKPSKLRGIESQGMVFCAASEDKSIVELVAPPEGSKVGDRVFLKGQDADSQAPDASINPKKKNNPWAEVMPFLKTNDEGVATFKGIPLATSAGVCTASLKNSNIS